MEYRGIKINIVIMIIVIVLIVYFTGDFIINRYNIEKPLIDEINALKGVENVELIENNDTTKLLITLNKTGDFYNIYKNINDIASEKINNNFKIILNNKGNSNLQNIYFTAHYAIFEGISTKQFTVMNENIKEIAEKNNLEDYKLWIDSRNIYLKLADSDSVFYHIIPRDIDDRGGESVG